MKGRLYLLLIAMNILFGSLFSSAEERIPFRVRKLSDRVIVLTYAGHGENNTVAVASDKGLVVVDTNISQSYAREIRRIISNEFGRDDFAYVVNTHEDWDHTGGNQVFSGAEIIAHRKCYERIKHDQLNQTRKIEGKLAWAEGIITKGKTAVSRLDPKSDEAAGYQDSIARFERYIDDLRAGFVFAPPTLAFQDTVLLDLGDLTMHVIYFGRAHREGDILVFIPEEKILITGDLDFDTEIARCPDVGAGYEGKLDVPRWLEALDEVMDGGSDIRHVVQGHTSIQTGDWLAVRRDYLKTLWEGVLAAKTKGLSIEELVRGLSLEPRFSFLLDGHSEPEKTEIAKLHQKLIRMFWNQVFNN